jgi:hypothetical protein
MVGFGVALREVARMIEDASMSARVKVAVKSAGRSLKKKFG